MLKTKGSIIYSTSDNPSTSVTQNIAYTQQFGDSFEVFTDTDKRFYYYKSVDKWLVSCKKDEYDELLYDEFDGKIISFEYTTYWGGGNNLK